MTIAITLPPTQPRFSEGKQTRQEFLAGLVFAVGMDVGWWHRGFATVLLPLPLYPLLFLCSQVPVVGAQFVVLGMDYTCPVWSIRR